ncbi:choline TMA-lyase-activating enzyme [uncultured Veillonella sp.]|uniref:choline TMA-lyase-activating enzyme n=1 Tax=uncultured Veillonella sp. TaxID=159268 RepID=UPI0026086252|nr:choline TMA-lyase-activating enzyme [uncultured Veillonella sp.]
MSEQLCIERKARIFNVQKYSIYDGPGIRTLIFFKGCPLRCRWCANPEGLERKYQVMFQDNLCTRCGHCVPVCPMDIHSLVQNGDKIDHIVNRETNCVGCRKCESVCPRKAIHIVGQDKTVTELVDTVQEDSLFYLSSGGGVTLGGGEVSTQPEAATDILRECQALGIHTAIETCGYAKLENLLMMAEHLDLFLFDIKQIDSDRHAELTGVRNELILTNIQEILKRGYNVKVRMPLIRGLNSQDETIRKTMEFLLPYKDLPNFKGIDILPYHKLGVNKYAQLDKEYTIKEDLSFKAEELDHIEAIVKEYDMDVKVVKH